MTVITVVYGLPFIGVTLYANNQRLQLENVLLDTGSAASVFRTDDLLWIGVTIQPQDRIRFMSGIGGREAVIEKQIEKIEVGTLNATPFSIQLGALDYGFPINGILGADFLMRTHAIVDFQALQVW